MRLWSLRPSWLSYQKCAAVILCPQGVPAQSIVRRAAAVKSHGVTRSSDHAAATARAPMKYRHSFHAGNFADVHKHVTLLALVDALTKKDKGFLYLDTHAG